MFAPRILYGLFISTAGADNALEDEDWPRSSFVASTMDRNGAVTDGDGGLVDANVIGRELNRLRRGSDAMLDHGDGVAAVGYGNASVRDALTGVKGRATGENPELDCIRCASSAGLVSPPALNQTPPVAKTPSAPCHAPSVSEDRKIPKGTDLL